MPDSARFAAAIDFAKADDYERALELTGESLSFRREHYGPEHELTLDVEQLHNALREELAAKVDGE